MFDRKILAALVGLSLAGAFGTAMAQTPDAATATTQSASPADTVAPSTAAKSDTTVKKTVATKAKHRHSHMNAKTHRKHVSHRATGNAKLAAHATKRVRLSHIGRHGAPKHV